MGFVKLSSDLKDWEWFDDKNTVYVYVWLLLKAAWCDGKYHGIEVKRGQLVTTYPEISKECNVTNRQARTILDRLKSTGKTAVKSTSKFSIITLIDYDLDNVSDSQNDSQLTVKRQTTRQSNDAPALLNTKDQNNRSPEIRAPAARDKGLDERFNKFWLAYPKKTAKQQALKAFERLKPDEELLNKMLTSLERQKKSVQWTKDNGQFIPYPATWLNGRRWEDELQEVNNENNNSNSQLGAKSERDWLRGFNGQ